jgi:hypothetical protein
MQRLIIKRVIHVAALVMVGSQIGQVSAADTVALLQHEIGNEAHRVQHDPTSNSVANRVKADTAFWDIQWHTDVYAITVGLKARNNAASRRAVTRDWLMNITRPIRLSTFFNVPMELDLFGAAKHRKSQAIMIRTRVKGSGFKVSLSCPW